MECWRTQRAILSFLPQVNDVKYPNIGGGMKKEYNYCMDFVKGIACFSVILMHCEFPGYLGVLLQCITRFSVPFFFMVSGYFANQGVKLSEADECRSNRGKIKHILRIILAAMLVHGAFSAVKIFTGIKSLNISALHILVWICLNQPVIVNGSLWFLFALLYVYIAYACLSKLHMVKFAYKMIPVLFCGYILLAQGMHLINIQVPNCVYRNFLFEGIPFFMLGHWLHFMEEEGRLDSIENRKLVFVIILTTLLCPLERSLLGRDFGVNIVTIPQVMAIFCLCIKQKRYGAGILQVIGKRYSMYIYVLHMIVYELLTIAITRWGVNDELIIMYAMPVFTCLITLMLSMLIYQFNNRKWNVSV